MKTKTIKIEKTLEIPDYGTLLAKNNEKLAILNESKDVMSKTVELKANDIISQITTYIKEIAMPLFECWEFRHNTRHIYFFTDVNNHHIQISYSWSDVSETPLMYLFSNGDIEMANNFCESESIDRVVRNWKRTKYEINRQIEYIINSKAEQTENNLNRLHEINSHLDNFTI